jgi:hypothetical protein
MRGTGQALGLGPARPWRPIPRWRAQPPGAAHTGSISSSASRSASRVSRLDEGVERLALEALHRIEGPVIVERVDLVNLDGVRVGDPVQASISRANRSSTRVAWATASFGTLTAARLPEPLCRAEWTAPQPHRAMSSSRMYSPTRVPGGSSPRAASLSEYKKVLVSA